jgi:hypothetical protein
VRLAVGLLIPLFALGVLSFAAANPHSPGPSAELSSATGRISVQNRRAGRALLVAKRLAPGGTAKGSVVLRNRSKGTAALRLTQSIVSSRRGPGGVRLLSVLRLTVREAGVRKPVFDGPIAKLRTKRLRNLPVRASRRYTFTVNMARSADNRYQAGSLVVRYRWTASGAVKRRG